MSGVDTRNATRNSLFMLADLMLENGHKKFRVKIRNISSRGLMAEGEVPVVRGSQLTIDLRHVGSVEGTVAWIEGTRFGVAFEKEIDADALKVKAPEEGYRAPWHLRTSGAGKGRPETKIHKV